MDYIYRQVVSQYETMAASIKIDITKHLKKVFLPDDWSDRIQTWIAIALQLLLIYVMINSLVEQNWQIALISLLVLTLTFLPAILERRLHVNLPIEFTLINCMFLYAAFVLGETRNYYERYEWWDLMLHSLSAMILGLIGFLFVYVFHSSRRIQISPFHIAVVSFGFAVTLGSLWEIFEFLADSVFGLNMQKSGQIDTMTDLMVNSVGALIAAFIGYYYVKGGDSLMVNHLINRFIEKNPRLFHLNTGHNKER